VVFDQPVLEYAHGSGVNQGNSVTGGVVYRGTRLPMLYGAYVFADYEIGNVWMMRVNGTNVVPLTRLTREEGIAAFGVDPRNGDVLTAHIGSGMVKRLVADTNQLTGTPVPPTLFQTGAFTNLMALTSAGQPLTPNVGVAPYDLNVPFWSDHAQKSRWVFRPNSNARFVFSRDGNWLFPTGTVWVKHFELELTNGMPSSTKRLETRLLVKNPLGVYGVTYRWGDSLTNATLVPEEGLDEEFTIYDAADGGIVRTQVWHYPGRSECLVCHTPAAGFALGFNTAQLNREVDFGRGPTNQLAALASAGYFNAPLVNRLLLPALAHATNSAWSREWRVRSFLAANCAQCHQPGGTALGSWDARYQQPLSLTGLLYGRLNDDWGDVNHRVIVPGSVSNSMLLSRLLTRGAGQMPPLASTQHDTQAISLLSEWITNDLAGYQTFSEWQTAHFGAPTAPGADAAADPDLDGAGNYLEWLTGTDPLAAADFWSIGLNPGRNSLQVLIPQLANRGFELQVASSLGPNANWVPLNLPENRPIISSSNRLVIVEQPLTNPAIRFYRVRVFEP
jgi:mono/diheme cytochrome c family protein